MLSNIQVQRKTRLFDYIARFIGFVIICSAATQWFSNKSSVVEELGSQKPVISQAVLQSSQKTNSNLSATSDVKSASSDETVTEADIEDHKVWLSGMGYTSKEDRENYDYYDEKTIKELAKNNDLVAIKALAKKATDNHDFEAAKKLYWQAAALGSTPALDQLALFSEPTSYDSDQGMDYVRSKLYDELAIYKVIEMRGDTKLARVGLDGALKNYEHYFGSLQLTEEDELIVKNLAEKKYAELQLERSALGFGDFKNSTSKLVKAIEAH